MVKKILVLSGNVGAGKTTLGNNLVQRFGATIIKTRNFLHSRPTG